MSQEKIEPTHRNFSCVTRQLHRPSFFKITNEQLFMNFLQTKVEFLGACVEKLEGNLYAIGCEDGSIQIWDYVKGSATYIIPPMENHSKEPAIKCLAYLGGNKIISSTQEGGLCINDYKNIYSKTLIQPPLPIKSMKQLSSNLIALGGFQDVYLLDLNTNKIHTLMSNKTWTTHIEKLSDEIFASCSQNGNIYLYDYKNARLIRTLSDNPDFNWAYYSISLGENLLGSCHDDGFRVWDYETGKCLRTLTVNPPSYVEDDSYRHSDYVRDRHSAVKCYIATRLPADNQIVIRYGNGVSRIWDYVKGTCLTEVTDHRQSMLFTGTVPIAYSNLCGSLTA